MVLHLVINQRTNLAAFLRAFALNPIVSQNFPFSQILIFIVQSPTYMRTRGRKVGDTVEDEQSVTSRSRSRSSSVRNKKERASKSDNSLWDNIILKKQDSVDSLSSDLTDVDTNYQNDYYYRDKIDPSIRFLYRPHTITGLGMLLSVLLWVALQDTFYLSVESNIKVGIAALCLTFLFFGLVYLPNGPFIRPHPAVWRLVLGTSVIYLMVLVFILFNDKRDVRRWLVFVDSSLGRALPEKSYAGNCDLTYDNMVDQFDIFVLAHSLGWFGKAVIMRDEWFLWILSVMFEFLEYSLQHQLPNFAECWWDHWILDVLVCNWLGLWIGMKTCHFFSMQTYEWRGFKEIPNVRGKVSRSIQQFLPHSFTSFQWAPTSSPTNYFGSIAILFLFLLCELNAFYLKYLMWIPPSHVINILRLCLYFLVGIVAVREAYQLMSDK